MPREVTAGADDVASPPTLVHGLHEVVQVVRQTAASAPRTKTSILPVAFDTAAGAEVAPPGGAPIDAQPDDQGHPVELKVPLPAEGATSSLVMLGSGREGSPKGAQKRGEILYDFAG